MNRSRVIWVNGKPYYAGGTLRQEQVFIGERSSEFVMPKRSIMRINVRDEWEPNKILGTLPWDGQETDRRFSWQHSVNGCPTQEILKLNVHKFIIGDIIEMAYRSGGHDIRVLRKLPDFAEKTDER